LASQQEEQERVKAERQEIAQLETEPRATEAEERLEPSRQQNQGHERLEHEPQVPPAGPVAPSTFPEKSKLRPVAGIMTLLALVIGLGVVVAVYKRSTFEPMTPPSVSPRPSSDEQANEVKIGDKVFLRSGEGSYVITAQIARYNWPRLGNEGKVILTLLGNEPLRHGSVVQIQSLEQNLSGYDVLGTFADDHNCYYWKRSSNEKRQGWIIIKLDASNPVLHYGDKIYLVNVYYDNSRLTRNLQHGEYLTVDEGVDWWWVLEKSYF
jgi:hypothetical protein